MKKIIRVATHSGSLGNLLQGQMRFMSDHYEVIGVGSAGEIEDGQTVIERLSYKEGVRVVPIEMTRAITPLKDIRALYSLYKLFKREKPFIVHSHTPKAGTLAMIAAKIAGVTHRLHTVAGLPLVEATGTKRKILNMVEKITYISATKVYPNSHGLKDIILENGFVANSKMKVIGAGSSNGIDTTHFDPELYTLSQNEQLKKQIGLDPEDFSFIFLGRIVRDKGINELVTAFKQAFLKTKKVKLLLVGYYDTPTAELSPETETEIETNENIILLEWQKDVRPFLSISDALAFPSYREGFPNTVLQASAMKTPSIVSNINGCNEIIKDGYNGVVIPVKSTKALQNAMEKLVSDEAYYKMLVQNSRTAICENYERQYVWESLLKEYNALSINKS